ncbi:MAG: adenine phosphoribosyltransferase, partial [Deltaproteobacteria bacterium]|nr:adenine phosphoribosyltransferase [Deltaproteobacteria bacterium]
MSDSTPNPPPTDALGRLAAKIRSVPDFPKPGILFRDITPLLSDPQALALAIAEHRRAIADLEGGIDLIVGIESRGFLFGMALAAELQVGFVPVRKPGKLPAETIEVRYALEYGEDALQIHSDAITRGDRVLLVDDL